MIEQKIAELIAPTIEKLGFELVRVTMTGGGRKIIEIMIDKQGDQQGTVRLEDCRAVSIDVSAVLDVEDVIEDKYFLEVSSAGAERPLVTPRDYERFKNRVAKIHLNLALDNKTKYKGRIVGLEHSEKGNVVKLLLDEEKGKKIKGALEDGANGKVNKKADVIVSGEKVIEIEYNNIKKANLVFTDEMFKQIMNKS